MTLLLDLLLEMLLHATAMTWIVCVWILRAPRDVLRAGRSRSGYKKLIKSMSLKDRLLMKNFVALSKTAKGLQCYFVVWTFAFYVSIIILVILIILYKFLPSFSDSIRYFIIIKGLFLDIPGVCIVIPNRFRRKHLRSEWKFIRDYRRSNSK